MTPSSSGPPAPSPSTEPSQAPEEWSKYTSNGDLTMDEIIRRRELRKAQAAAETAQRMAEVGLGGAPLERLNKRYKSTYELEDDETEDEGMDPVEVLRQRQASARRSTEAREAAAQTEQANGELDKQIQEQTNSVNFYILQFATDLMAFDVSCLGLTLPITLPIYDILIVPILGFELRHALKGTRSIIPYFPKLTWQSFMKPGGGGETPPVPLPQMVLCVLVFFVMLLLGLLTLIEAGFIAAIIYAWQNPTEAGQMLSGFLGMPSIPGL